MVASSDEHGGSGKVVAREQRSQAKNATRDTGGMRRRDTSSTVASSTAAMHSASDPRSITLGSPGLKGRRSRGDIIHSSTLGADVIRRGDEDVAMADYTDALAIERSRATDGLSVYVHLPFCPSRCLTCDHQTSVSHDTGQIDHYLDAMEREVALVTEHLGTGQRLQQLHLGGGTPNYLTDLQLVRLIDILDRHFRIDDNTETSLEANAHRASLSQLTLLRGLGFRGLNLELRDLDPGVQEALGRRQSLAVVRDVVESARAVGFDRVSTDLVYGLPRQSSATIQGTIEKLIALDPDRISCYTYSRRPELFQHQCAVEERQLPSIADKVAIFSRIVEGLCTAGYEWIGLDCFSRADDPIARAQRAGTLRRNWIGYTALPGRSLVGFGSSSISDLSTICVRNDPTIDGWQRRLTRGELPIDGGVMLSPELRQRRHALSDLFCNLQLENGSQILLGEDGEDPTLRSLREDGFIDVDGDAVTITESGRYALHQLWGDASPSYRWGNLG